MSRKAGRSVVPPRRKTEMRAAAREIVEKTRWRRKYHLADDEAGCIARAMEDAYRQGIEDSAHPVAAVEVADPTSSEPLDLRLISRNSSSAFELAAREVFGGLGREPLVEQPMGYLHRFPAAVLEAREERWAVLIWSDDGVVTKWSRDRLLSRKAVGPWRTQGLVQNHGTDGHLIFTPRAFATWRAYLDAHPDYVALWSGLRGNQAHQDWWSRCWWRAEQVSHSR